MALAGLGVHPQVLKILVDAEGTSLTGERQGVGVFLSGRLAPRARVVPWQAAQALREPMRQGDDAAVEAVLRSVFDAAGDPDEHAPIPGVPAAPLPSEYHDSDQTLSMALEVVREPAAAHRIARDLYARIITVHDQRGLSTRIWPFRPFVEDPGHVSGRPLARLVRLLTTFSELHLREIADLDARLLVAEVLSRHYPKPGLTALDAPPMTSALARALLRPLKLTAPEEDAAAAAFERLLGPFRFVAPQSRDASALWGSAGRPRGG
ncbi:MAG: hypothetical protein HY552_05725 [Elusimicrobia bacterium]|nr:hypothetical protein [Elusimicrobiota bacterium]